MIINRTNLETLFTGFNASFRMGLIGQQAMSDYAKIAMVTSSMTAAEVYPWLGKIPGMKEWIGERVVENLIQHAFEIRNKDYEDTIAVDRNQIEDDQFGVYNPMFQALGEAVAAHPDEMVFSLLKKGETTLCYDGQNFFDTDHPVRGVGVVSNLLSDGDTTKTTPWYLLDLRRTYKPIVFQRRKTADTLVRLDREEDQNVFMRREFMYGVHCRDNAGFGLWQMSVKNKNTLDQTNFAAAYKALEELKGDEGRPLGLRGSHLLVPPALREEATKLMMNELGSNGETNTVKGWAEVIVSPWLT